MSKEDVVNEIHKNARVNFPRRCVLLRDIDDLWQADLIDVQKISNINSNNNFILIVIDCFSKYVWVRPLKNKTKDCVTIAFQSILHNGRVPLNLQTDWGKEFYNKSFKKLMQVLSINHYSTYSTKKASIVERVIRTIKGKLYKKFSLKGNYKWVDGTLEKVVNDYNHTKHSTIQMYPARVNKHTKHILMQRYNILNKAKIKKKCFIGVGDVVRISKHKANFDKGYTPNWSTELFKVSVVQNTDPTTYLLEDSRKNKVLGSFYAQELQKTRNPDVYLVEKVLKKKGNKVFVKWLGLPSKENSWISNTNIL